MPLFKKGCRKQTDSYGLHQVYTKSGLFVDFAWRPYLVTDGLSGWRTSEGFTGRAGDVSGSGGGVSVVVCSGTASGGESHGG